jgi:hypothetical protein
MNLFDQITLLATGLVAIFLIWRFFGDYRQSARKPMHDIYYMISFTVLLVAGLLLIAFGYDVLASPLVIIVAVLIPAGLSLGLVAEFLPKFEKPYLIFALVGLAAIAVTRFVEVGALKTVVLVVVHSVAGLLIFGLPLWVASQGKTSWGFAMVTIGGGLIGLGGIALAFLKADSQLLFFSPEVVFAILAPLPFLMTGSFAIGFVKEGKAA